MHHRGCNPEINMEQTGEKLQDPHPVIRTLLRLKLSLIERFRVGERQFMLVWSALIGLSRTRERQRNPVRCAGVRVLGRFM